MGRSQRPSKREWVRVLGWLAGGIGSACRWLPSLAHLLTDAAAPTLCRSQQRYQLPRYIPVASELYDFLQDNAMPTV
jgi:hypothetical protein